MNGYAKIGQSLLAMCASDRLDGLILRAIEVHSL